MCRKGCGGVNVGVVFRRSLKTGTNLAVATVPSSYNRYAW